MSIVTATPTNRIECPRKKEKKKKTIIVCGIIITHRHKTTNGTRYHSKQQAESHDRRPHPSINFAARHFNRLGRAEGQITHTSDYTHARTSGGGAPQSLLFNPLPKSRPRHRRHTTTNAKANPAATATNTSGDGLGASNRGGRVPHGHLAADRAVAAGLHPGDGYKVRCILAELSSFSGAHPGLVLDLAVGVLLSLRLHVWPA